MGKHVKIFTDHSNLQLLKSVSPKQAKLVRWWNAVSEFEFTIYHTLGKKNIVPDVLSRAPLPIPTETVNNFVLPHIKITAFIAATCFLSIFPIFLQKTQNFNLILLYFVCTLLVILPPTYLKSQTFFPHLLSTDLNKDSPPKHVDTLTQNNNFTLSRPEFVALQQEDKLLRSIILYLRNNSDISVLNNLAKQEQNRVIQISKRCKLINSDELVPNPQQLRFYVPSNSDLQRQLIKIFRDSPTAMN